MFNLHNWFVNKTVMIVPKSVAYILALGTKFFVSVNNKNKKYIYILEFIASVKAKLI